MPTGEAMSMWIIIAIVWVIFAALFLRFNYNAHRTRDD